MIDSRLQRLRADLAQRREQDHWRSRLTLNSPQGVNVTIKGQPFLSFCSNDYLGLASDPRIAEAAAAGLRQWGTGSGSSHLLAGHCQAHAQLEEQLAHWCERERAMLFGSGYLANLALASCYLRPGDLALHDRLNHASLLDGARLAGVRFSRYRHTDCQDLERHLQQREPGTAIAFTDGVFSMDGDIAPLADLAQACARHQAWLAVDDAHGLGVLGEQGRGSVSQAGLGETEVPLLMGTLGKAFGCYGAFVAGPAEVIEYLLQFSRTATYTTALPPALASAASAALEWVASEEWRRQRLRRNIIHFRDQAISAGLNLLKSETPIQPILLGSSKAALALSTHLDQAGILAPAIRPPTVPPGSSRLRISLSSAHRLEDIDRLVAVLEDGYGSQSLAAHAVG